MKYFALVFLVSAVFAGSANAVPKDAVATMCSLAGTILVTEPSTAKMIIRHGNRYFGF